PAPVSTLEFQAGPGIAGVLFVGAANVYRCPRQASPAWWQSGYAADCKSAYAGSIPTQASTPDAGATHRRPRPGGEIGRHKGLEDLSPPGETPGVAPVKFGERPGPRSEPTPSQASGSPKEGVESRRRAPVAHRAKVKACSRPRTAMAGGESRSGTKIPRPRGHAGSSPAPGTIGSPFLPAPPRIRAGHDAIAFLRKRGRVHGRPHHRHM